LTSCLMALLAGANGLSCVRSRLWSTSECKTSEYDLLCYLVGAVFGAHFAAGFGAAVSAGASKLLDAGVEPP